MTTDQVKAAVINFQKRIPLQKEPNYLYRLMKNILYRYTQNETCIEEDNLCEIVTYLHCNLPAKEQFLLDANIGKDPLKLSDPCKAPYDIQITLSLRSKIDADVFTLITNPEYFIYGEDGSYYFDLNKYLLENIEFLPSTLVYSYAYQEGVGNPFVNQISETSLGYYTS